MANVVVVSSANCIEFTYNDLSPMFNDALKTIHDKGEIHISLMSDNIRYEYEGCITFFSYDGINGYQVDTIDSVAPISNDDLYNKFVTLKG